MDDFMTVEEIQEKIAKPLERSVADLWFNRHLIAEERPKLKKAIEDLEEAEAKVQKLLKQMAQEALTYTE